MLCCFLQLVSTPGTPHSELLHVIAAIQHSLLFKPSATLPFASVTLRCLTHPKLTQAADFMNARGVLSAVFALEGPVVGATDFSQIAGNTSTLFGDVAGQTVAAGYAEQEATLHGQKFSLPEPVADGQPTEAPAARENGSTISAGQQRARRPGQEDPSDDLYLEQKNLEHGSEALLETAQSSASQIDEKPENQERAETRRFQVSPGPEESESLLLKPAKETGLQPPVSSAQERETPGDTASQESRASRDSARKSEPQFEETGIKPTREQTSPAANFAPGQLEDLSPRESTRVWSPPVAVLQLLKDRQISGAETQRRRTQ